METSFYAKVFKGLFSTSSGTAVTVAFHFLSIVVMTRFVSKEDLGLYFLIIAVVNLLKIVSGLGLELTLVKFVSNADPVIQQTAVTISTFTRFLTTTLVSLIFLVFSKWILSIFDAKLADFVPYIIWYFVLINFEELLLGLMQGMEKFKEYSLVQVLSAVLRVVLLFLLRARLNTTVLMIVEVLAVLPTLLIQIFVMRAALFRLAASGLLLESFKRMFQFSFPLYLNNLLSYLFDRSSTLLIGALTSPLSVATFEIAQKVPEGFMRLFNAFIVVYFPSQSKLWSDGKKADALKFMNYSLILFSTALVFLVLAAYLFGREIVALLFSEEYIEVTLAFALLMFNFFLRAVSNILGYSLVSAGRSSAPVKANIVSIIVNFVSCFLLIPRLGYLGAVYSLLLMNTTSQIMYVVELRRSGITPVIGAYLKPILVLAGILSVYILWGEENFFVKLLFLGLYLLACWAMIKELQKVLLGAFSFLMRRRPKANSV